MSILPPVQFSGMSASRLDQRAGQLRHVALLDHIRIVPDEVRWNIESANGDVPQVMSAG